MAWFRERHVERACYLGKPMASLTELHRSVAAALASKRVGVPVFVRYLFHFQGGVGAVGRKLAEISHVIRGWFDQDLERLYVVGSIKERALSLTLEFRGGATAIVSWAGTAGRGSGVDLVLLGNHGSITFDSGTDVLWEDQANLDLPPAPAHVIQLVERALTSRQPETAAGGKP